MYSSFFCLVSKMYSSFFCLVSKIPGRSFLDTNLNRYSTEESAETPYTRTFPILSPPITKPELQDNDICAGWPDYHLYSPFLSLLHCKGIDYYSTQIKSGVDNLYTNVPTVVSYPQLLGMAGAGQSTYPDRLNTQRS